MTHYIATVTNDGTAFYLRGTTWAFDKARANLFDSKEAALGAVEKARKFMKPSLVKKVIIEEVA
jgi:hypothetical protein